MLFQTLFFIFTISSFNSFSMPQKSNSNLSIPIELRHEIESLEIDPTMTVEENFEKILPLQVHSIINRWNHYQPVKKLINKQIKNLIKTSYSKEEFLRIFFY